MQPEQHAARLLAASDTLRSGALERLLIDEAVSIADAVGASDLAYGGRLRLISAGELSGDTEARLAALDWCLATHLSDPQRFPARTGNLDLLWELTTIPDAVAASPEFGLDVIVESLNTLRSLLERHGEGLSALRHGQVRVARIIASDRDLATAERTLEATPLDDYSPCHACRQSEHAVSLAEAGRFDEAAAAFDLLFDDPGECAHEPELSYARSLEIYLRAGQPKKAARSHQVGYELVRNNPRHLHLIALHLNYCRMTDAVHDGIALLERHLAWLVADPLNGAGQFEALFAMAALLDAACDAGMGAAIIHGSDNPALGQVLQSAPSRGHSAGQVSDARLPAAHTASSLATACWQGARRLAAEFDDRNGTTKYGDRIAAGPTPPINLHPAVQARLARNSDSDAGALQASFASLAHDAPASELWLQLARERATVEDSAGAAEAIRWAHEALDQEVSADGDARPRRVRAALYGLSITLALEGDDAAEAERLAGLRADVLIEDERLDLAEVELQVGLLLFGADQAAGSGTLEHALTAARKARVESEAEVCILNALAALRLKQGRAAEAAEFVLTAVKRCGPDPDNPNVHRPLILLAHAQAAEGDFDGVSQTCNRLLRHTLDRATRANALLLRASACHGLSRLNAGIADADRALSLYLELGYSKGVIDACARLALLLEEMGVQSGVAEAWRHAVTEAERINHPETGVIRFRLARALITAGKGAEAVAEFDSVLDATVRARAADSEISEVLYWLGHAQRLADDDELAYCCWSVALSKAAAAQDARACVRLGLALGRLLLDDDDDSCLDVLNESVNQARHLAEPWELVDALHLLGQAQCAFDDPAGLRTLDEAVAVADDHAFDIDALLASITESRAHGLDALGRDAEALESARRSARLYERLGERSSAGLVRLFTARLLTLADRTTEALGEYQRSVELLSHDGAAADVVSRELRALTAAP